MFTEPAHYVAALSIGAIALLWLLGGLFRGYVL